MVTVNEVIVAGLYCAIFQVDFLENYVAMAVGCLLTVIALSMHDGDCPRFKW